MVQSHHTIKFCREYLTSLVIERRAMARANGIACTMCHMRRSQNKNFTKLLPLFRSSSDKLSEHAALAGQKNNKFVFVLISINQICLTHPYTVMTVSTKLKREVHKLRKIIPRSL